MLRRQEAPHNSWVVVSHDVERDESPRSPQANVRQEQQIFGQTPSSPPPAAPLVLRPGGGAPRENRQSASLPAAPVDVALDTNVARETRPSATVDANPVQVAPETRPGPLAFDVATEESIYLSEAAETGGSGSGSGRVPPSTRSFGKSSLYTFAAAQQQRENIDGSSDHSSQDALIKLVLSDLNSTAGCVEAAFDHPDNRFPLDILEGDHLDQALGDERLSEFRRQSEQSEDMFLALSPQSDNTVVASATYLEIFLQDVYTMQPSSGRPLSQWWQSMALDLFGSGSVISPN